MKITYNSPNRSHHYPYAASMRRAGCLHAFVSGYSRFGRDPLPEELAPVLRRVDALQTLYVLSLRYRLPRPFCERLAWLSKCRIDAASYPAARDSDLFLFYSGAGLRTMRRLKKNARATLSVVEAVNTHARFQEQVLGEEHQHLGLDFHGFPDYERARRCQEYEEADAIVCPSRAVKRSFVAEGIPAENIWVVPYGFPIPVAPEKPPTVPSSKGGFTVLYVGSLSVRKGIRYLIEAFKKLQHPGKRLVLVGPSSAPSGIGDLSLGKEIECTGVLKGEALAARYREADVFVQPSLEEGLSLVLGEALAQGLPIVATRESGVEELFDDGVCGYHVQARSASALAGQLQNLADDAGLRVALGQQARQQAGLLGGWEQSGENLVGALGDILAAKGEKSH
ncbi:MAG: glycosyltransferase [Opitutales bacterium]